MALTNSQRQAAWAARRNRLARIAEALKARDVKLFVRLEKEVDRQNSNRRTTRVKATA